MALERMVCILAVGVAGAWLARRFRMPGGTLIGAMLASGVLSLLLSDHQAMPSEMRSVSLILLGTYIGSSLDREGLRQVRPVLPYAAAAILVLIAVGCVLGLTIHRFVAPHLAVGTLVLGTMPGGVSGLTAIAGDLGAEFGLVASMHMVRLMIVFGLLPFALARIARSGRV